MDSECDQCAVGTGRRDWPGARCEKVVDWTWTSYTAAGQLLAGVPECATSLTRPVETSLECRSHSSTPNTTPLPCRGKVDSHILMVLLWTGLTRDLNFSGSFLYVAFLLTSCVIIVPTLWQSGGRDGAQAGKFLRTYQRSSRSPFNARAYSYKRNSFGNMHCAWHLDCNILTMFHITS